MVQRTRHHRCVASSPLNINRSLTRAIGQPQDFTVKTPIFDGRKT
jgi:hypothetical protein